MPNKHLIAPLAVLAVTLALRLHGITRDLNHDEAYTWEMFASQPYSAIAGSCPVPKQHIPSVEAEDGADGARQARPLVMLQGDAP